MEVREDDDLPPLMEDWDEGVDNEDESQQLSEPEAEPPSSEAKKPPQAAHKAPGTNTTPSRAGGGRKGASGKSVKPPNPAGSAPKGTGESTAAVSPEPLLWKAFARSRAADVDRLGLAPLKKWQAFEAENSIPDDFRTWYLTQVLGNRSVPKALNVPGLPSGFPEFCHWVADGYHTSSGGSLMAGFLAMAEMHVKRVKAEEAASASISATQPPPPWGQPPLSGGVDPTVRRRERRSKKGGIFANGSVFAEKMKNALDGLEKEGGLDDAPRGAGKGWGGQGGGFGVGDYPGATAVGRASRAGARAAAEVAAQTVGEIDEEDDMEGMVPRLDAGEVLGPAFAGSRLPPGTQAMAESLRRARAFRRRSERQAELLERELERCLARMARVECQYRALSAETRGKECSLDSALESALPLMQAAHGLIDSGFHQQALERYDDAIKLLEVHVNQSNQAGRESEELLRARELLGLSLCNRSVTNMVLGNNYSGTRDVILAEFVWPNEKVRELRRRIEDFGKKLSRNTASNWRVFPVPL